jgi:hypothetical protein
MTENRVTCRKRESESTNQRHTTTAMPEAAERSEAAAGVHSCTETETGTDAVFKREKHAQTGV